MPRETQSKLLRLLVEPTLSSVLAVQTDDVQVDVRVITSTSRDLEKRETRLGNFREDLYSTALM